MKKTILISGIKGFLGQHLAAVLQQEFTVFGIGRQSGNINGITVFSSVGIDSIGIVPDFVVLCHAAVSSGQIAVSKALLFEVNVGLTQKLIQKFNGSKIIYISSASVYGLDSGTISENSPVNPTNDYAASKLAGEKIALESGNAAVVRLSSLYGNGMKEVTIIPNYVNQALKNQKIEVWGSGERRQNYIAVEDACSCIKAIIENFDQARGTTMLCVAGEEYPNNGLAQIIAQETQSAIVHVNQDASPSVAYNNQATQKLLNWSPKTKFKNGIANYIQWKKEQF